MILKKPYLSLTILTLLLSLIVFPLTTGASHRSPKLYQESATSSLDANRNKIFDDLEKIISTKPQEKTGTIVVFKSEQSRENLEKKWNLQASYEYNTIPAVAATLNNDQVKELAKEEEVKQVEYDAPVKSSLNSASSWFGATKARGDFNLSGDRSGGDKTYNKDDVVVAIIDTGIDNRHYDLDGGKVIAWKDFVQGRATPYDDNGHGTHVASIAAGEGDGNSAYKGAAPGAALAGLKVLDALGYGYMSTVNAAIDWTITNKDIYGIEIINLSLGTTGSSDGTDSTSQLVNKAVWQGLSVFVAAGNEGPRAYTIGSPGAAAEAITVGAMADPGEKGFFEATFSSRGPTADGRIKPDISAPGYRITAAKKGTTNRYTTYSGTSMATPFAAGVGALMLDANPSLTPTDMKSKLMATPIDWGPSGTDIDYGAGRLDAYEAIKNAGGFSGSGPAVPAHYYQTQSLPGTSYYDKWTFTVTTTAYPIGITFIMPNWASSSSPDFDIYLYNGSGRRLAFSYGTTRQETIAYKPSSTGNYTLKIYSYTGQGNYFFDLSAGSGAPVLTADNLR